MESKLTAMPGAIAGKLLAAALTALFSAACQEQQEHTAEAIMPEDSVAMMTTYGVNTLVSDSGVIKYRILSERWEVNQALNPSRWIFAKGLLLTQFDEKFHIHSHIQADTAYYYDKLRLWELRGRVGVKTKNGLTFNSEELFWDEMKHELYSNKFSRVVTPERTLQGAYFRSDERMTKYYVSNSKGSFEKSDFGPADEQPAVAGDTAAAQPLREPAAPSRRSAPVVDNKQ